MAKSDGGGLIVPLLLIGGAWYAWKSGMLGSLGLAAPTLKSSPVDTTAPITPSTPPVTGGGVKSPDPTNGPQLDVFGYAGYVGNMGNLTGSHDDLTSQQNVGSIKVHGGSWALYAKTGYQGNVVYTNGLDYADAGVFLSPLGGVIGSAKYLGKATN